MSLTLAELSIPLIRFVLQEPSEYMKLPYTSSGNCAIKMSIPTQRSKGKAGDQAILLKYMVYRYIDGQYLNGRRVISKELDLITSKILSVL